MIADTIRKPIEILLVEDNPGDVRLTKEALKEGKIINTLHVVENGADVMTFLDKRNGHAGLRLPDLILLDLNLPRMDGREVLELIKSDVRLRHIPVIVLTSSAAEEDIYRSYDLHANCYITKPVNLDRFITIVQSVQEFWLEIVKLPRNS